MTGKSITDGTKRNRGGWALEQCSSARDWTWAREAAIFAALVSSGVALRLAGHEWPNFAPVAAMALFAGYFFRSALVAVCVPLTVMAISDQFLGGYHWGVMVLVYGMLVFPVLLRGWLRQTFVLGRGRLSARLTPLAGLLSCSLLSSILFFVVTNFGVWLGFATYETSWSGLCECYMAAIPFFRYTLAGDLFFAVVLFGSYALALSMAPARQPAAEIN
jgi:hypothetical protein